MLARLVPSLLVLGALACTSSTDDTETDVASDPSTDTAGPTGGDTGEPVAPLSVTSTFPSDGDTGVEPTAQVLVSFSEDLDATTVTADTVQVFIGGQPVAVRRDVVGSQIELEPLTPWRLRADVTVTVGTGVVARSGATLPAEVAATFQIRDGAWDALPGQFRSWIWDSHPYTVPVGNHHGEVVFPITHLDAPLSWSAVDAFVYDPERGDFDAYPQIRDTIGVIAVYERLRAAVSPSGDAVIVTRTDQGLYVDRLTKSGWKQIDVNQPMAIGTSYEIGLTATGVPVAAWVADGYLVASFLDERANVWSTAARIAPAQTLWSILQLPSGDLQFLHERAEGGLYSVVYSRSFAKEQLVSAANVDANWVRHTWASDGARATWQEDGTHVVSASWNATRDAWSRTEEVAATSGGGELCSNRSGLRIAVHRTGSEARASVGRPDEALAPAQVLAKAGKLDFARCFLDDSGNGHALWAGFGTDEVLWSRFVDGAWDSAVPLPVETDDVRGWFEDEQGRLVLIYGTGWRAWALHFR